MAGQIVKGEGCLSESPQNPYFRRLERMESDSTPCAESKWAILNSWDSTAWFGVASSGWIKRLLDNATLSWGAVRVPGEVLHHTFEKEKKDDSQDQRKQ